jgi:hypothetical protein
MTSKAMVCDTGLVKIGTNFVNSITDIACIRLFGSSFSKIQLHP